MHHNNMRIMKKTYFIRVLSLLLALLFPCICLAEVAPLAFQQDATSRDGLVRVRLSSLGSLGSISLNLRGAYSVNNGQQLLPAGTQVKISCNSASGTLTLSASGNSWNMGNSFTLNRSDATAAATIAQSAKTNPYPGDFTFCTTQKNSGYALLIIAHIQMEDYLYGVLPYELGNSAPLEALKAQAVAARTYTIRMMENRAGNQYDVVDTDADQVYHGTPSGNENCKAAVRATRGMVLKYGNRYAETYYSSSNGGQTESALNVWGGKGYDYLIVKDDPYDAASGSAKTKTATIYRDLANGSNRQALLTLLKQKAVANLVQNGYAASLSNTSLIWLENLTLHTPKYNAPSKLYTKADFQITVETVVAGGGSASTSVTVTTDLFRDLEGILGMSLTSSTNEIWNVSSSGTAYTLKAGRYGHGVGMSQYGAMEMARQGYAYDEILGFYYPGCINVKLNLTDEPMDDAGDTLIPEVPKDENNTGDEADEENAAPETTPAVGVGYATVIANGFVNLRAQPSLSAPVLGTATQGDTVTVLSMESSWAFVEYHGIRAYAVRSLLSPLFQKEDTPQTTPDNSIKPEDQQPGTPIYSSNQMMIFCMDGLVNFREAPDRNSRVRMQLPHGTILESSGTNGAFTSVTYQGIQGYVMTAYLVPASVMNPQKPSVTTPPQTTVTPSATPAPESTPLPSISDDEFQMATVTTQRGSLNLRFTPSEYARVLIQIPQYTQLEATKPHAGWCKVRYAGMEGYVMSEFLTFGVQNTPLPAKPQDSPSFPDGSIGQAQVTTKSGSLNLRMSPEPYAAILTTIPKGRVVEVYSVNNGWAMVSYRGYAGYAMTAYLTMQYQDGSVETKPQFTPTPTSDQSDHHTPSFSQSSAVPVELPQGYSSVKNTFAVAGVGNAYLRFSPSQNDRVLKVLSAGEQVTVLATSTEWCIVQWNDATCYIDLSEVFLYRSDGIE